MGKANFKIRMREHQTEYRIWPFSNIGWNAAEACSKSGRRHQFVDPAMPLY